MRGLTRPARHGKVHSFANQYIETSFYLFLIPYQSYFVNLNTKETLVIPLNITSLKNYYFSFAIVFLPLLFFVATIAFDPFGLSSKDTSLMYLPVILVAIAVTGGFALSFLIGRPGKHEIIKRVVLQKAIGNNALPEWLDLETVKKAYDRFNFNLPANWKDSVRNADYSAEAFYSYYTTLIYDHRIAPTKENIELLALLDKRILK